MDQLNIRFGQRSGIYYVLLCDEQSQTHSFVPPLEFHNEVLAFVSRLPKDIMQLGTPLDYYETMLRMGSDDPYRFHVKYSHNLPEYLQSMPANRLYLFFIDLKSTLLQTVCTQLLAAHNDLRFYHFFNDKKLVPPVIPNVVDGPGQFLHYLIMQQTEIFSLMGVAPQKQIVPSVSLLQKHFFEYTNFVPAQINYHIANCITGNFDYGVTQRKETYRDDEISNLADITRKNNQDAHTFNRQKAIIKQTKKVDHFAGICLDDGLVNPVTEVDPEFPPLILVAPFQNPDLEQFFDRKIGNIEMGELKNALHYEQSENYINFGKILGVESFFFSSQLVRSKSQFLDDVAWLHSSFTFSPVMRLPAQGKTLYRELSFFRHEVSARLVGTSNSGKLLRTIQTFGRKFRLKTISKELGDMLMNMDRQIVAISDLPVEWLDLDGIPLAFSHDVCRLPETALHGLMANFVAHEQFRYLIPRNLLKRTLVVFGSDEPAFRNWHPLVKAHEADGVITRECLTVDALAKAVAEFKPDLLIIDSHGDYDAALRSSVLYIGNEKLTGDLIIEYRITAPLVFLSACNTAPTYGTINTIANAFFEVGAMAVTTTFLPINVYSGSILYLRLLNNLKYSCVNPVHQNWLAFISYLLRTSAIEAAFTNYRKRKNADPKMDSPDQQGEVFKGSLSFFNRREIFARYTRDPGPNFASLTPEFLFYSTLGRADLIKFACWQDAFIINNPLNIPGKS